MAALLRVVKWTWKSWPLFLMLAVGGIHYAFIVHSNLQLKLINDFVALSTQLVGGLLVLYSIDSTIGILRGTSLKDEFKKYLSDFPLIKRSVVATIGAAAELNSALSVGSISVGLPDTVEKQIIYLQNQIDGLKSQAERNYNELNSLIIEKDKDLNLKLDSTNATIEVIDQKFTEVSLGGVKIQLLGVVLMIYGSVTSYAT